MRASRLLCAAMLAGICLEMSEASEQGFLVGVGERPRMFREPWLAPSHPYPPSVLTRALNCRCAGKADITGPVADVNLMVSRRRWYPSPFSASHASPIPNALLTLYRATPTRSSTPRASTPGCMPAHLS